MENDKNPLLNKLFSPIRLKNLIIPNRLMMSGMHLGMESADDIYGRMAHFFSLRARGNVGLIVVGGCSPNEEGKGRLKGNFSMENDLLIKFHRRITDAVHVYESKIALQICHFGRESFHGKNVSASSVRAEGILYTPKEMSNENILKTVSDFADAASRAQEAGYDAIEIVGSQGFLLHQFLNSTTNLRNDEWGGNFSNRMRFSLEIVKAVREKVGNDYPVIFRFPGLDLTAEGNTFEEVLIFYKEILRMGVDLINIGIGCHDSKIPTVAMTVPRAAFSLVGGFLRQNGNGTPIAISNRINNPMVAEELLVNGITDIIAMARPLLADPDFIKKSQKNKFFSINTCIACNQACLDHALKGKRVSCMVNPSCGDEREGKIKISSNLKKLAIIGGGITGMCAALYLKQKGHDISLYEKENELGGQLLLAAKIPGRGEFYETIRYHRNALYEHGVKVHLHTKVDQDFFEQTDFDHIVIATGYEPKKINVEGSDQNHIFTFDKVLKNNIPLESPIVIVGAGAIALNLALYMYNNNQVLHKSQQYLSKYINKGIINEYTKPFELHPRITILNRSHKKIGRTIGSTTRWITLKKISELNINLVKGAIVKKILKDKMEILFSNNKKETIEAKTIVWAIGQTLIPFNRFFTKKINTPYTVLGQAGKNFNSNAKSLIREAYRFAETF